MGHRYIGSKTKLINDILRKVKDISPDAKVVCDLMTGTASVASSLKAAGYKVVAADVMTYSFHHARVVLLLDHAPNFESMDTVLSSHISGKLIHNDNNYLNVIDYLNSLPGKKGYFWNEFSSEGDPKNATKPRNYFSPGNAMRIDAIREEIKNLYSLKKLSDIEHSLLLHDLIMAVNDVANISGTYGHYLAKLSGRANSDLELKPTVFNSSPNIDGHQILLGHAENLASTITCDVCYIDPPYMKRQYAANYHILETLARGDSPEAIGESGLRPWRDQYSNFCTKTKIRESFTTIIENVATKDFLISYSEDGLLKISELEEFLSQFGKVSTETVSYRRFKSNNSKLDSKIDEFLIHLKLG